MFRSERRPLSGTRRGRSTSPKGGRAGAEAGGKAGAGHGAHQQGLVSSTAPSEESREGLVAAAKTDQGSKTPGKPIEMRQI